MTKADLITSIVQLANISKAEATLTVDTFIDSVQDVLAREGKFSLVGFGSFSVEESKARQGHNPRTGDRIFIPAGKTVKFKASSLLKKKVQ